MPVDVCTSLHLPEETRSLELTAAGVRRKLGEVYFGRRFALGRFCQVRLSREHET